VTFKIVPNNKRGVDRH